MTRKTTVKNTFKPQSMLAKLCKLADGNVAVAEESKAIADKAAEAKKAIAEKAKADSLKIAAPLLQSFLDMGEALAEAHPDGLDQETFDETYKGRLAQAANGKKPEVKQIDGLMSYLRDKLLAKGFDEKRARSQASVQYNDMRAALIGAAHGMPLPEGCTSVKAYGTAAKAELADMFNQPKDGNQKAGRKAGKVAHVANMIDVKELSGKRGKDKDIASEIIDMIRIAKDLGKLGEVHAFLLDLTDTDE